MNFRKAIHATMIQAAADGDWELTRSIQITPSEFVGDDEYEGVVTARPHATGWFISARRRRGLDSSAIAEFKDFAAHSAYLLLQEGPESGAWIPGATPGQWWAYSDSGAVQTGWKHPQVVPSQWSVSRAA